MSTILIIEDEQGIRDNILEILHLEGFETLSAENGIQGIELAKKHIPDLIICDIMMPELDGYGVLVELRSDRSTEAIPFVFLTALAMKSDFRKGMGLGAEDYLTKPLKIDDLLNTVEKQLEKKTVSQKKVDELKLKITSMLPHELNTPLASIVGFAEMLSMPEFQDDKKEIYKIAKGIEHSAKRLQRLVENYLLYTDLSLGKCDDESNKCKWNGNIAPFPDEYIREVTLRKASNKSREHDIKFFLTDELIQLPVNTFMKILEELIDNALKFSKKGTDVEVETKLLDDKFILSVKDCGRGIRAEQLAQINAFNQFDRPLYEQQGSGLGLIIAKKLAEINNGELVVESNINRGTIVNVVFSNIKNIENLTPANG